MKSKISLLLTHLRYFGIVETVTLVLHTFCGDRFKAIYDESILRYLRRKFRCIIDKYRDAEYPQGIIADDAPIWIFWAQGVDNAPDIVRKCLDTIRRNAENHPIYMLDLQSVKQYVDIPAELWIKVENKEIGLAHFSDILRHDLLTRHGGIWIDSCIILTRPLPTFTGPYYTAHVRNPQYLSSEKWVCGFQAGLSGNPLHTFVRDMLVAYHIHNLPPIHTLFMDHIYYLAYTEIPAARKMIESVKEGNIDFHYTSRNRDQVVSQEEFDKALGDNLIMRASYHWEPPANPDTLYWKILEL